MGSRYSTREVARLVDLPPHRIQALARLGVVGQQPPVDATDGADVQAARRAFGRPCLSFDFADLRVLRLAAQLIVEGVAPIRLQNVLAGVRQHLMRSGGQLSAVSLVLEGTRLLARDAQRVWDAESGQTLMPFEVTGALRIQHPPTTATLYQAPQEPNPEAAEPAAVPSLGAIAWNQRSADTWFDMALAQEETEPVVAYELYLRALACDPEHVEAMLNIGRLCSLFGDRKRAIAYFKVATAVDAQHPVAHFNMAVTLHDAGELDQAEAAYRAALHHDPYFADAHYNLATLLEQQGARDEASQHFVAYRLAVRPSPPA